VVVLLEAMQQVDFSHKLMPTEMAPLIELNFQTGPEEQLVELDN
jgi:hypothetical protein